jgi:hypothetical protein
MLDIEYVSELTISHLYGLQNKKSNLDKYYRNFETEFPDRETAISTFSAVLGELSQLLDWPTNLRWKKKTDFFTLFLVLAERVTDLPFDRETRTNVAEKLVTLSAAVDAYLKEPESSVTIPQARGYGRAAARAASDLANRRARAAALSSHLFDLPYELEAMDPSTGFQDETED